MSSGPPWKAWYKTARWRSLRLKVFLRDLYTCQRPECGRLIGDTSQLVCDHIKPHRGNAVLFWDEDNCQTLCKPCHDAVKQAEEQGSKHQRGVWDFAVEPHGYVPSAAAPASTSKMARPDWFRKVQIPTTVVCGPPGAGKSTYVRNRAGADDRIICFDEIATSLFNRSSSLRSGASLSGGQIADVLRVRNEAIADLMYVKARERWRAAWIILVEPNGLHRQWWADTLHARVVLLLTPQAECLKRIAADAANGDDRGSSATDVLSQWWNRYTSTACDQIIQ